MAVTRSAPATGSDLRRLAKHGHEETKPQILFAPVFDGRAPRPIGTGEWLDKVRKMRRDPTLGFARDLAAAPILSAEWAIEIDSDPDAEEEEVELLEHAQQFIDRQMRKVRLGLLRHAINGMVDFGWQSFEKVLRPVRDQDSDETLIGLARVKPLLQDFTEITIDNNGNFTGVFNLPLVLNFGDNRRERIDGGLNRFSMVGETWLSVDECVIFARGIEGTNWYGEPLMRRAEYAYDRWLEADAAAERYYNKLAGSHWVIHYPLGSSLVAGEEKDNALVAKDVLNALQSSGMVAIPNKILDFVGDLNSGQMLENAWQIEMISANSSDTSSFNDREKHLEALMVRALNLPERAILEGQYGTKAEAAAHADFAISLSEMWHMEIVDEINLQVIDDLVEINYGARYRGRVKLVARPLTDEKRQIINKIYSTLISTPDGLLEEIDRVDWDAVRSSLGIPVKAMTEDEELEIEEQLARRKEQAATEGADSEGGGTGPGFDGPGADENDEVSEEVVGELETESIAVPQTLNGAQITAVQGILTEVTEGKLPTIAGIELLIAVGIEESRAKRMVLASAKLTEKTAGAASSEVAQDTGESDQSGSDAGASLSASPFEEAEEFATPFEERVVKKIAKVLSLAKEFDESKVKREGGQFATGGGGGDKKTEKKPLTGLAEVSKSVKGVRTLADGSPLPDHIPTGKIPPAWTDVQVARSADATLLIKGRDSKGRRQAVYSESHSIQQAGLKFARTKELLSKREAMRSENMANLESSSRKVREAAAVMSLIDSTGLRPGSDRDTGAAKQAFGATTLRAEHVKITGDTVRLEFTGKKGVARSVRIIDPDVASMLRERKSSAAQRDGRLFQTSSNELRVYTKSLDGGKFKPKDFRTAVGTSMAIQLVKSGSTPQNAKSYKIAVKKVAEAVAKRLGNTSVIALQSYIDPTVFSKWRPING